MSFYNLMYGDSEAIKIEYLIVGGGGGSGGATVTNYLSGGGGAGGYTAGKATLYVDSEYTVTVGAGGGGGVGSNDGSDGGASAFYNISVGGGGGGGAGVGEIRNGRAGSSGGGGRIAGANGGAGTSNEGNNGGGVSVGISGAAGGGGGASVIGQTVTKNNFGGWGGDGFANDITGTSKYYAGGGGGGGSGQDGQGGLGGGGGRLGVMSHDFMGVWTYDEGAIADVSRWDNQTTYLMTDVTGLGVVSMHGYSPRSTYTITHSQLPGHSQVRYQCYWHFIDSVDSEYCSLTIAGQVYAEFRKQGYRAPNQGEPAFSSNRMASSKWVRAEYSYMPFSNSTGIFCAPGYVIFDSGWIDHTSSSISINHYFGLDQAQGDESSYVSHVKIQTRQPKGPVLITSSPSDWSFLHNSTSNWTMECWFKAPYTAPLSEGTMFYTSGDPRESGFWLGLNNSNSNSISDATATIELYIMAAGLYCVWSTPTNSWTPNVWNHIAVTFNMATRIVNIFINGKLQPLVKTPKAGWTDNSYSSAAPPRSLELGTGFLGTIFNWRIVKGIVYTTDFTPDSSLLTIPGTALLTLKAPVLRDESSYNFNITSNSVTLGGDASRYYGVFAGGTNLSIGPNSAFQFGTGDFTIEAWCNFDYSELAPGRLYEAIYSNYYPNWVANHIWFGKHSVYGGKVAFWIHNFNPSSAMLVDPNLVTAGNWIHYAVMRKGNTWSLFRNGSLVASNTYSGDPCGTETLVYVGSGGDLYGWGTHGKISNFRIVRRAVYQVGDFIPTNRVLPTIANTFLNVVGTPPDVTQDLSNHFLLTNPNEVELSLDLPFNLTGSSTNDAACVGHFVVNNSKTAMVDSVSTANITNFNVIIEKIPDTNINAIRVGGSNGVGYVSIPSSSKLQLTTIAGSSYTITAWVYRTGPGSYPSWGGEIINKDNEYEIAVLQSGILAVALDWGVGADNYLPGGGWILTSVSIPLYQAIHIAVVVDNTVLKICTNGTLQYTNTNLDRAALPSNNPVVIGNRPGNSQQFDGYIGDVQIWNRALTISQVSASMTSSAAGLAGEPNTGGGAGGLGLNTDTQIIMGVSDAKDADGPTGKNGATPINVSGLFAAIAAAGSTVGTGGSGSDPGDSEDYNNKNGGAASGVGAGGGGAGFYGGNGGAGSRGGGGGGAAGYTNTPKVGGAGGGGFIVIQRITTDEFGLNPTTNTQLLTSGTSYSIPNYTTSLKAWVIGAGGGGGGSINNDSTAGGGGGAGGCAYKTWTSLSAGTATYVIGAAGTSGSGANNGGNGGDTSFTLAGTTITGKGGSGGYYNNGVRAPGGKYTISGDATSYSGATGGSGGGASGDKGGAGGGAIGSVANSATGYPGGSGVVIIRHEDKYAVSPIVTGDPTITTVSGYKIYQWNSSGSVKFKTNRLVNYLVVAGGGGGGAFGGGGGAGGFLSGSYGLSMGESIVITVGSGGGGSGSYGSGGTNGTNGTNSSISSSSGTVTAIGGGGGGTRGWYYEGYNGYPGNDGGSGGGGSPADSVRRGLGGAGTTGQGFSGGAGGTPQSWAAGGGGGAGGPGGDGYGGLYSSVGGDGGIGLPSSITGSTVYYAGGGGGCVYISYYGAHPGAGGIGGGGAGAGGNSGSQSAVVSGTANTGGGGGGGPAPGVGASGGSGIVILSYPDSFADPAAVTGNPQVNIVDGKKIYKFINSGTITF